MVGIYLQVARFQLSALLGPSLAHSTHTRMAQRQLQRDAVELTRTHHPPTNRDRRWVAAYIQAHNKYIIAASAILNEQLLLRV